MFLVVTEGFRARAREIYISIHFHNYFLQYIIDIAAFGAVLVKDGQFCELLKRSGSC
jgi:hypothetical protein